MGSKEYSFWNGKNLNGGQDYFEAGSAAECAGCECRCVVGGETVAGDDL